MARQAHGSAEQGAGRRRKNAQVSIIVMEYEPLRRCAGAPHALPARASPGILRSHGAEWGGRVTVKEPVSGAAAMIEPVLPSAAEGGGTGLSSVIILHTSVCILYTIYSMRVVIDIEARRGDLHLEATRDDDVILSVFEFIIYIILLFRGVDSSSRATTPARADCIVTKHRGTDRTTVLY